MCITNSIPDLIRALEICGAQMSSADIKLEDMGAPHSPPTALPKGKMAVYIFLHGETCLKVGKAGPKSNARYTSHHYGIDRSNSSLAKSIVNSHERIGIERMESENVGAWLKSQTRRINILLDSKHGNEILNFVEAFYILRLGPIYEGRSNKEHTPTPTRHAGR